MHGYGKRELPGSFLTSFCHNEYFRISSVTGFSHILKTISSESKRLHQPGPVLSEKEYIVFRTIPGTTPQHSEFYMSFNPVHFTGLLTLLLITGFSLQGAASQVEPLPLKDSPGFHPGLFGAVSTNQDPIPPRMNTYDDEQANPGNSSPVIRYTLEGGDPALSLPSFIRGQVTGVVGNASIIIAGRENPSEPFIYLATIESDEDGSFLWPIPEWASKITDIKVKFAR
jgi:hypothetical protein